MMRKDVIAGVMVFGMVLSGFAADVAAETALGDIKLRGYVAERLEGCLRNHLMATDEEYLTDWYRWRQEVSWWHCEFWGKWMHSAAPFSDYRGCEALKAKVEKSVKAVVATQDEDGYLGNYLPETRNDGPWTVWGSKYTLLGLLHAYEMNCDPATLAAAERLLQRVFRVFGKEQPLHKTGFFRGLPSCSILEPVVWLYRLTGKQEYRDFADYVVREMDAPAADDGAELIDAALRGVDMFDRPTGLPENRKGGHKAYEMMSCYQGLLDYWEINPSDRILKACVASAKSIAETEVNIAGGSTSLEHWYRGTANQLYPYRKQSETCVLTTWMRLCEKLLTVTKDPYWADQFEKTFYNAYLAALKADGSVFSMYHPLSGFRNPGEPHCRTLTNCCNANGPRGFLAFLKSFLMAEGNTVYVNHFAGATASIALPSNGEKLTFEMYSRYPQEEGVYFRYRGPKPMTFTMKVRIPAWSSNTVVKVQEVSWNEWSKDSLPVPAAKPGEYYEITRRWTPGDKVDIRFDMTVRPHVLADHVAFTRGPIALARDLRFGDGDLGEMFRYPLNGDEGMPAFTRLDSKDTPYWILMDAAFLSSYHHDNPEFSPVHRRIRFCDFASAGNTWTVESSYRTWFPIERMPPHKLPQN